MSGLQELQATADNLIHNSVAPTTRRSYSLAVKGLSDFCKEHKIKDKFSAKTIELYVAHLAKKGMKASTIRSALSAVRHHCNSNYIEISFDTPRLQLLLKGVRRRNDSIAIRPNHVVKVRQLQKICNSADKLFSPQQALMIKAMFALSFFALLRPSEAYHTSTTPEHQLRRSSIRVRQKKIKITFSSFKHSSGSTTITVERKLFLDICPVLLLQSYLSANSGIAQQEGSIVLFHCSRAEAHSWLQRCVADAGIKSRLTLHSFRRGGATWYAGQGLTDAKLKAFGRWKSNAYLVYVKP